MRDSGGKIRKKRIFKKGNRVTLFSLLTVVCMSLSGCGHSKVPVEEPEDSRIQIVCTIFPAYDWVCQILGDQASQAEITLLMKNGSDLHSYQPTVWDMKKIKEADLFVYVGGESDLWVEAALQDAENPDREEINLMELLKDSVQEEEQVEGMQLPRGHSHEEDGEQEEEPEYDEHIWLSLRNADKACTALAEALGRADSIRSAVYEENCRTYQEKLRKLDEQYSQAAEQVPDPVILFGDRFPFRYLTEDYGITYYAAFEGCSAETEASFETIVFLTGKAEELKLPAVLAIDGSDQKLARTIAGNTRTGDQKVLMLDSMQSVSEREIEAGENYFSIMERNLEVLREALSVSGGEQDGSAYVQGRNTGI